MQIHCLSQCKTYLLSTTAGVKVHFPIFHLTAPSIQQITFLFFIWKWAQKQEYNAKFGDKWPLHPNGKIRENSFWKYVFPTFAFSCLGRQQSMLVVTQPSFDHGSACFLCNSLINHSEFLLILSRHQVKTGNQIGTLSHC